MRTLEEIRKELDTLYHGVNEHSVIGYMNILRTFLKEAPLTEDEVLLSRLQKSLDWLYNGFCEDEDTEIFNGLSALLRNVDLLKEKETNEYAALAVYAFEKLKELIDVYC